MKYVVSSFLWLGLISRGDKLFPTWLGSVFAGLAKRRRLSLGKLRVGATMVGVFMLAFSGMAGAEGWKKIEIAGEVPLSFETVSDIKIYSGIDEEGFLVTI